jgi:threonine/homoserine/homoserine lactone efflux protein
MGGAIRLLGGVYLIWLALRLWRAAPALASRTGDGPRPALRASFATGLLITLGDQKAILFYLGFLPAFVDLRSLDGVGIAQIALVAILAVGGVKLAYAVAADRAAFWLGARGGLWLQRLAAVLIFALGLFLVLSGVSSRA